MIEHSGIIESIDSDRQVTVRIIQVSACATCSVKGHCSSADSKEKLVSVPVYNASAYKPGDSVQIVGTSSMGLQAVTAAFIIPFFLIVITLFAAMHFTGQELWSALLALAVLVPYYALLYANRTFMKKKFSFTIKQINN